MRRVFRGCSSRRRVHERLRSDAMSALPQGMSGLRRWLRRRLRSLGRRDSSSMAAGLSWCRSRTEASDADAEMRVARGLRRGEDAIGKALQGKSDSGIVGRFDPARRPSAEIFVDVVHRLRSSGFDSAREVASSVPASIRNIRAAESWLRGRSVWGGLAVASRT